MTRRPSQSTLFPYTTLFRSSRRRLGSRSKSDRVNSLLVERASGGNRLPDAKPFQVLRSEEHTSELQSQSNLVCRLLLEKKNDIDTAVLSVALVMAVGTSVGIGILPFFFL